MGEGETYGERDGAIEGDEEISKEIKTEVEREAKIRGGGEAEVSKAIDIGQRL